MDGDLAVAATATISTTASVGGAAASTHTTSTTHATAAMRSAAAHAGRRSTTAAGSASTVATAVIGRMICGRRRRRRCVVRGWRRVAAHYWSGWRRVILVLVDAGRRGVGAAIHVDCVARPRRRIKPTVHVAVDVRLMFGKLGGRPLKFRTHRERPHGMHGTAGDGYRCVAIAQGQTGYIVVYTLMNHNHRNRMAAARHAWRQRTVRDAITARQKSAEPRTDVDTTHPPGLAATESRGPTPAEAVIEIPGSALVRQVPPRIGGGPDVAIARRVHPAAVSIWIPAGIGRLICRPDIALPRHVIPVPIGIQIVPGRVLALVGRNVVSR